MSQVATTKLSSRGQVVIPEEIRQALHFEVGTKFVVIGKGDTIILKSISPPPISEFRRLLAESHKAAKRAGITKEDLKQAIKSDRRRKSK